MPIAAEAKAKGPTIEIVLMYFEPKSTCTTRLEKTVSVPAVKMPTNVVILRAWMKTLRLSTLVPRPLAQCGNAMVTMARYKQRDMCCDCSCGVSTSDGGGEKVTGEKGVNADESGVTGKGRN